MSSSAVVFGASAALAWGLADVGIALATRRAGFFRTVCAVHLASVGLLLALALVLDDAPALSGTQWALVAMLGPLGVFAHMGFYRALELGPIAIVSPIASANGALVVLLAVGLLGESLAAGQALGCAVVLGSVVLASLGPGEALAGPAAGPSGIRLAVLSSLAFGVYLFGLGQLSGDLGWLLPILLSRSVSLAVLAVLALQRREWPWQRLRGRDLAFVGAVGGAEAAGYLLFNRGTEVQVALTAAAASAYPLIPILVGLALMREHVRPLQLLGVVGVLGGMAVLGLS